MHAKYEGNQVVLCRCLLLISMLNPKQETTDNETNVKGLRSLSRQSVTPLKEGKLKGRSSVIKEKSGEGDVMLLAFPLQPFPSCFPPLIPHAASIMALDLSRPTACTLAG